MTAAARQAIETGMVRGVVELDPHQVAPSVLEAEITRAFEELRPMLMTEMHVAYARINRFTVSPQAEGG